MKLIVYSAMIGFLLIACSPKRFERDFSINACQNSNLKCERIGAFDYFSYNIKASGPNVDILIVNDNSGSMSFEQKNLSDRFQNFIDILDSQYVNYRIAFTTTDIAYGVVGANDNKTINGKKIYRDGNLIPFNHQGQSKLFITPDISDKESIFSSLINREETLFCENYLVTKRTSKDFQANMDQNCPSGDERGIYAAKLATQRNETGFIRSNAHLAIIFLADEDVRSSIYMQDKDYGHSLTSEDSPAGLINSIKSQFPGKTLSIHSIIVRPGQLVSGATAEQLASDIDSDITAKSNSKLKNLPNKFSGKDLACLNIQSNQVNAGTANAVKGSYGYLYSIAARLTNGVENSICESDFSTPLKKIGGDIVERINSVEIACSNPNNLKVESKKGNSINYRLNGKIIEFTGQLESGDDIDITYSCPTL